MCEEPYHFVFYGGGGGEPAQVRVERAYGKEARFWIDPVRLAYSHGFSREEVEEVRARVEQHPRQLWEIREKDP